MRSEMMSIIEQAILSTDMARHGEIMKALNHLIESKKSGADVQAAETTRRRSSISNVIDAGKRDELVMLVIKAADISNTARPAAANERWCNILMQEFHRQAGYMQGRIDAGPYKYDVNNNEVTGDGDADLEASELEVGHEALFAAIGGGEATLSKKQVTDFAYEKLVAKEDMWSPFPPVGLLYVKPPPPFITDPEAVENALRGTC